MILSQSFSDLPAIPPTIRTRDQQVVNTREDKWRMRSSIWGGRRFTINWQRVEAAQYRRTFSKRAWYLTALYLMYRLESQQARTAEGEFESIVHFERWLSAQVEQGFFQCDEETFQWSNLSEAIVTEYIEDCRTLGAKGRHFLVIRGLYRWGVQQGYQDFDSATLKILDSMSVTSRVSGHVVCSWDPRKGPLSADERWLLKQALKQGQGQAQDRILIQILLEIGIRPQQMLLLRNQDFKRHESHGVVRYELAVTTIKRRTQERETQPYPITPELGRLLEQQQGHEPDAQLLHWLPPSQPDSAIRRNVRRFAQETNLISPRTGKRLNLYPYRLRYTLATYLSEMGAPAAAIAAALNHKGIRSIGIYIKTTAAISDKLAKAIDPTMEPLVQRFLGQALIDVVPPGCQSLILNRVPHLQHLQANVGVVGVCQHKQPEACQRAQPLACYVCPSFAALKQGPHQDLLQAIQAFVEQEQDRVNVSILQHHNDAQIAIQQLLTWIQVGADAGLQETARVGVKPLAGVSDRSKLQALSAADGALQPTPEQDVVNGKKVPVGA